MTARPATTYWPLWGLRIHVADLVLQPMTEADLDEVVAVLPPDLELDPSATRYPGLDEPTQRAVVVQQAYWRHYGTWSPTEWRLNFCVRRAGRLIGVQELEGNDFPTLGTVDTSSWLVAGERGRGAGKGMRRAVLALAFGPLSARAAVTSAWEDNAASLGVSRSMGYRDNGVSLMARPGHDQPGTLVHLRMTRDQWAAAEAAEAERTAGGRESTPSVEGFEPCRPFFGQPSADRAKDPE